jgi:leader peptidase (prepilin peptidase)/N-methyltransferase
VNAILSIPIAVRLAVLFVCGALAGSLINLACYTLAWNRRAISPWSAAPKKVKPRTWRDRVPVMGWLGMRRESKLHGSGFWIRPALVELLSAVGFAWFYWWSCGERGLLIVLKQAPPAGAMLAGNSMLALHLSYLAEIVLISLMAVASLIDIDEQTIPDSVTIPGTLVGLLFAAAYPWSLLPDAAWTVAPRVVAIDFLRITSPGDWPGVLELWPGLLLGCLCWWAWCVAMMPLRWYGRHGWGRGLGIVAARVFRHPYTWAAVVGSLLIAACWYGCPPENWAGLLTALVGLAVGGGMIWIVRIIGTALLQQEAMGFGDVTLMAMIGTFIGWQSCLIVFFLAPFAGAVIAVAKWIFDRHRDIAYGPFLCLGTLVLIVGWAAIWSIAEATFAIWWLVPALMAVCVVLLVVLLGTWVWIRQRLFGER